MKLRSSLGLFRAGAFALLFSAAACRRATPPLPHALDSAELKTPITRPIFSDVTASCRIAFPYANGEEADQYTLVESLGG